MLSTIAIGSRQSASDSGSQPVTNSKSMDATSSRAEVASLAQDNPIYSKRWIA
jgi:hypothetical protein